MFFSEQEHIMNVKKIHTYTEKNSNPIDTGWGDIWFESECYEKFGLNIV